VFMCVLYMCVYLLCVSVRVNFFWCRFDVDCVFVCCVCVVFFYVFTVCILGVFCVCT